MNLHVIYLTRTEKVGLSFYQIGALYCLHLSWIGAITGVADDRDHFAALPNTGDNASNWFMIPLVDKCVAAGLSFLGIDQCYGLQAVSLLEHFSFLADIQRQTKSFPTEPESR